MRGSGGYIRLYRSLLDHHAFRNQAEAMAFACMVLRAAWQPTVVRYKGRQIHLERRQLAISIRDFATDMDRDKAWVERMFQRLRRETMIETRVETLFTVITILNYDDYQGFVNDNETLDETDDETGMRQSRDSRETQNKEQKESKELNLSSEAKASSDKRAKPKNENWHRLPDGWVPTRALPAKLAAKVMQWPSDKIETELDALHNWAANAANVNGKGKKQDWDKAWHGWLLRADTDWRSRNGQNRNGGGQGGRSNDGFTNALRDMRRSATDSGFAHDASRMPSFDGMG